MRKEGNWYCKSYSFDICFCKSDCKNIRCHRNLNGEHFEAFKTSMEKRGIDNWRYSVSDFGSRCKNYWRTRKDG